MMSDENPDIVLHLPLRNSTAGGIHDLQPKQWHIREELNGASRIAVGRPLPIVATYIW
jgi:hypothetical protein